jgi:N-acetyl-anhydromuramyl-L-alanine amidase AmpD
MAGNMSAESCGNWMKKASTRASSNYGIDSNGRIGLYVEEKNGAWCTSSRSNDMRAITIEVANTVAQHPWPISDKAYKSLILLLVDICKRNNIKQLLWQGDKDLIGQVDKQNMTVHRWFANKACPGDYLYNLHSQIAAEVNMQLLQNNTNNNSNEEEEKEMTQEQFNQMMNVWLEEQAKLNPSDWSAADRKWAESKGIIKGDEQGRLMYKKLITREEVIALLHRVVK